jgi:histidinol-phosphate phosphatase family protein
MTLSDLKIGKTWTLFLDRDGVINKKIEKDYVRNWQQFEWLPNVKIALTRLKNIFGRIIVVTNQQGIGKKLMTEKDLEIIHENMKRELLESGGNIDAVYFAPQLKEENSIYRKPNAGMAQLSQKNFPEIIFSKSIMAGDSLHDMEFGRNAGMFTVFLHPEKRESNSLIDFQFPDLFSFAIAMETSA